MLKRIILKCCTAYFSRSSLSEADVTFQWDKTLLNTIYYGDVLSALQTQGAQ
jgi:hypothetical protein